ncbi:MAG: DUF3106 domain-containing protein [Lentimonas sp.]
MKTYFKITCLALCCFSLSLNSLLANKNAARPEGPPPDRESRLLQHFLEMDSKELANLRLTVERIEKMTPEEKQKLSSRIGKMQKMDPKRIEQMREKYQAIPEEARKNMRQRWLSMSPEEREAWRKKLTEMSHEERGEVFKKEGFLPARPKNGKKEPPSKRDEQGPRPPPRDQAAE